MRAVRSRVAVLLVVLALVPLAGGCRRSSRPEARSAFITQLQAEGGLSRDVAECIVDRFFAGRTDQELKDFFERPELSPAESEEFGRWAQECAPATTDSGTSG